MFGFVRPFRDELKMREYDRFRSVYCGLCHEIARKYGFLYTLALSYDCAYLALVLMSCEADGGTVCRKRCIVHPLRRHTCVCGSEGLSHAAAVSVILTCHKLSDTIADEHGIKRLGARLLRRLYRRGYRRAVQDAPDFDRTAGQCLSELAVLEREQAASLDRPADTFARLLRAAVPEQTGIRRRVLEELFYHIGRWIYLIDACDDLKDDFASGSYNPIRLRFALSEPDIQTVRPQLEHTLLQSLAASYHAYLLLDPERDGGIIENVLCQGLPAVTYQVLDGTYHNNGGKNRHGSI
ncbi:MAG: DUF5685 family protein [Butyricicoccaceae bacterium]